MARVQEFAIRLIILLHVCQTVMIDASSRSLCKKSNTDFSENKSKAWKWHHGMTSADCTFWRLASIHHTSLQVRPVLMDHGVAWHGIRQMHKVHLYFRRSPQSFK